MNPPGTNPNTIAKPLAVLVLALALSGCSGGGDQEQNGGSGRAAPETTSSAGGGSTAQTTVEETSVEDTSMQSAQGASGQGGEGMSTALEGVETARSEAEEWSRDAELYSIVSRPPEVNAEGENGGWQYAFVSSSENAIAIIPYSGGESRGLQEQQLPASQVEAISGDTLPVDELVDSPDAIEQSEDVRTYLEDSGNGVSASVDSATSDEPQWILQAQQGSVDDRVPAVE